ncbi:MAG: nucleoside 2-deoxyribosyltransferase [Methanomicrobiales archaeon]|nr:nucleoside 2-deoxyribosyltransferase [Methanomicrobiales archaeon]
MYVLACPCLADPSLRARGITTEADRRAFARAIERCARFGIEVVRLPCPETLHRGRDREPTTYLAGLDTPAFAALLDRLERDARDLIARRGPPLAILGVDASPTCGVHFTHRGGEPPRQPGRGAFLSRFPEIPAFDAGEFARYRVYLAAPLFSDAERTYNARLRDALAEHLFAVHLPQERSDGCRRDRDANRAIFADNVRAIRDADIVVAVCDGADADSGTAWEMGFAHALGKPVYAIRSDFRMAGACERVNLMLEESAVFVRSIGDLLQAMRAPLPAGMEPPP